MASGGGAEPISASALEEGRGFAAAFKQSRAHLKKHEKQEVEQGLDVFFLATEAAKYEEKATNNTKKFLRRRRRRPVLLEIFAGIMMLSRIAMTRGWCVLQPEDLENGGSNLLTQEGRKQVEQVIEKFDPDLVSLAPPCSPWSSLQRILPRDLGRRRKRIMRRDRLRKQHRPFWNFTRKVVQNLRKKNRLGVNGRRDRQYILENPWESEAWNVFNIPGEDACVDQCRFNLKAPGQKLRMRKRTRFRVQSAGLAERLTATCTCPNRKPKHHHIEGNTKVAGKSVGTSKLACGWTPELCHHLLAEVEA